MGEKTSARILGGNPNICNTLCSDLMELGFHPMQSGYLDIVADDIIRMPPCIIILELTLFDHDAFAICELLSGDDFLPPETALIALVSENTMGQIPLDDRFADFIKFPYDIAELDFRLRRIMYLLHQGSVRDIISIGNLFISPSRCEVKIEGQPVVLTFREYQLLKHLIVHNDHVSTCEELLASIWGNNVIDGSRTVDVHIRRIRAKIGDIAGTYISTVRGVGYILNYDGQ